MPILQNQITLSVDPEKTHKRIKVLTLSFSNVGANIDNPYVINQLKDIASPIPLGGNTSDV